MKVLYQEATDHEGNQLPVEFLDGNGKLWEVPFGEPAEFENAFMADKILEHMKYMGVVEVHFTKTKTGITYDVEDAKKRAHKSLLAAEKLCINDYVKTQLESRVSRNYPPLPPVGRALSCVIKHKVNLLAYGLRPVGWEPPYEVPGGNVDPVLAASLGPSAVSGSVDQRLMQLEKLIQSQQQLINALLTGKVETGGGGKVPRPRVPAAQVLSKAAEPEPKPQININEGADDTYESINL